jgi:para-nitrobenzyl esterase
MTMAKAWLPTAAFLALAVTATDSWAAPPTASTASGKLEGTTATVEGIALDEFLGIPYAAPPVGALRWKPPQPAVNWQGARPAQAFGAQCMQLGLFDDMVFRSSGMTEDCLFLNVWKPAGHTGGKLPVLVYFYGGGFNGGDGSEKRYDGASMATRGIVTVTVNYRLGVFGFMAHRALDAESPDHASGNYGLLDQTAALQWVKANIAAFGGDLAQVTIAGESAGSMSVSAHMASKLSRGLFARAIGESGAVFAPLQPRDRAAAEAQAEQFAAMVGKHSIAELRAMPAKELMEATRNRENLHWRPVIDGRFFTQLPEKTFQSHQQADVPLLLGSNSQEGACQELLKDRPANAANYRQYVASRFGPRAGNILAQYPAGNEAQALQSCTDLASDLFIAHSTWRWMELQHRTGAAPVWFYYYAQPRPAKNKPEPGEHAEPGAVHSAEIEYALGNLEGNKVYAWTDADRQTSRVMQAYFANFIIHGDPNGKGLPTWPAVAERDGGLPRQTIDAHTRTEIDRHAARHALLQSVFEEEAKTKPSP